MGLWNQSTVGLAHTKDFQGALRNIWSMVHALQMFLTERLQATKQNTTSTPNIKMRSYLWIRSPRNRTVASNLARSTGNMYCGSSCFYRQTSDMFWRCRHETTAEQNKTSLFTASDRKTHEMSSTTAISFIRYLTKAMSEQIAQGCDIWFTRKNYAYN